eukprot:SAG22_NODE_2180_length_2878_cov_1.324217_2_plen_116_part_00
MRFSQLVLDTAITKRWKHKRSPRISSLPSRTRPQAVSAAGIGSEQTHQILNLVHALARNPPVDAVTQGHNIIIIVLLTAFCAARPCRMSSHWVWLSSVKTPPAARAQCRSLWMVS